MEAKYWTRPDFRENVSELDKPFLSSEAREKILDKLPNILGDRVPEWYWFDATEDELKVNVHQAYFDIANAGRRGGSLYHPLSGETPEHSKEESFFTPLTYLDQEEWATLVLDWDRVFKKLDDDPAAVHEVASLAERELDSIVSALSLYRFDSGSQTPQLIAPLFGSLALGGQASRYLREFFVAQCEIADQEEVGCIEASGVLRALGNRLFGKDSEMGLGAGVLSDGRFVSNTGVSFGTGSLEVMPSKVMGERGYFYSSHNLDSPLTALWAFGGLARLVGDAHRHYDQQGTSTEERP